MVLMASLLHICYKDVIVNYIMDRVPPEQRLEESTNFILEVLDTRHDIVDALRANFTTSEVATNGYAAHFTPPPELVHLLNFQEGSETVINTRVMRSSSEARELGLISVELVPADGLPLKLTADHGMTVLEQGDDMGIVSYDLFRKTLESVFADNADPGQLATLSDAALLDMILTLSPETQRDYHFELDEPDRKVGIHFTEQESSRDSVHAISVELLRPHVCGADVGTQLSIRETLLERSASIDPRQTNHVSDILAQFSPLNGDEALTVEAILHDGDSNKRVPLRALTHYHMADVHDALHALRNAT